MKTNIFYNLPILETERLILRALRLDDVHDVFEYGSDPEVSKYVSWRTHESLEDSKQFLQWAVEQYHYGEPAAWGVVDKTQNKLLGTCGFVYCDFNNLRCEIGYAISRNYWGRGLVTEAARRVIDFGFNEMNMHRIEARCNVDNIASARVMEKCGMSFEGILRGHIYSKGEHIDLRIYSILREEWD